ncbi:peptide-methionine (S)-S-oxide reductase MsrA [Flavobacteriaceae bacterium]|nr:peptide-methionine (S)-S-oxide reductase MsrA [Flavobacteriaceae bacterium]
MSNIQQATIGGGCFWCLEAFYNEVKGILKATSGYSGGSVPGHPTYREICSGLTGHAEVIRIEFDSTIISYKEILLLFFTAHNPTTLNQQGADKGTQYRSVIFYENDLEKEIALETINEVQKYINEPIVTEVSPLINYYDAEDYHQGYYKNNPEEGYCSIVVGPKLNKLRKLHASILK